MDYKYEAIRKGDNWIIRRSHWEGKCLRDEFFEGYDFMGSVDWVDSNKCVQHPREMSLEEAEQIIEDLKAADMDFFLVCIGLKEA